MVMQVHGYGGEVMLDMCNLIASEGGSVCTVCGKRVAVGPDGTRSFCKKKPIARHDHVRPKDGLGDITEKALKSIGVTKDRYKAAKELFGMSPTCSCDKRKKWLNRVSDWWMGEKDA